MALKWGVAYFQIYSISVIFLLTANLLIIYRVVSSHGTEVLATLGIGFRIVQSIYLPSVALSEAMAAMVG